jgi:hypothetical protein
MVAIMNTPTVQKQFTFESDIPYIDLCSHACANLELDPLVAKLGFCVSGVEGPRTKPSSFDNEADHLKAMVHISKVVLCSRSKEYGIEIIALVCGDCLFFLTPESVSSTVLLGIHSQASYGTVEVQKVCA